MLTMLKEVKKSLAIALDVFPGIGLGLTWVIGLHDCDHILHIHGIWEDPVPSSGAIIFRYGFRLVKDQPW